MLITLINIYLYKLVFFSNFFKNKIYNFFINNLFIIFLFELIFHKLSYKLSKIYIFILKLNTDYNYIILFFILNCILLYNNINIKIILYTYILYNLYCIILLYNIFNGK